MAKTVTHEEAVASQKEAKAAVKEAKAALTTYFKENKLKRSGDYSADKKHGKKITKLEKDVERAQSTLSKQNELVKELKPESKPRTKYEYPDDIDTPEKRKKYRQEQRALAAGKTPGKKKTKSKAAKKETAKEETTEETSEEAPAKKATKKTSTKKRSLKKKSPKKASKKNEDD